MPTTKGRRERRKTSSTKKQRSSRRRSSTKGRKMAFRMNPFRTPTKKTTNPYHHVKSKNEGTPPVCAICLEELLEGQDVHRVRACGHCYHASCMQGCLKDEHGRCPLCRGHATNPHVMNHRGRSPPRPRSRSPPRPRSRSPPRTNRLSRSRSLAF